MLKRKSLLLAFAALLPAVVSKGACADDAVPQYELVLPDGGVRFQVTRDLPRGTMHFTSAGLQKVSAPPVITLQSSSAPGEVSVTAVADENGLWRLSHPLLTSEQLAGTISVQVGDRTRTAPLLLKVVHTPRHGGQLLEMCNVVAEAVHQLSTGTVTVYLPENSVVSEAPVITVTEPRGVPEIPLQAVPGRRYVWKAQHNLFKTTRVAGVVRARIDEQYCDAELGFVGVHGGRIVRWPGRPAFELVPDPNATNGYVVYFLDEMWEGRAYAIERPVVVWGTGTDAQVLKLVPVPEVPRAFRVPGVGLPRLPPADARLRFFLSGRPVEIVLGAAPPVLIR